MDRFNRSFKNSNENTTCELYTDIVRLTKIYVVNFLTEEAVRKAGDKIHLVDMDKVALYDNLCIGDETWLCISALEEEMDTKPFLCIKAFYSATLQKFFKKFPFGKIILQDFGIVQLTKSYTVSTIKRLAKRFPQIELDSPDSLHLLDQEFTDFLLSPEDLPDLRYCKDCNEVEKLRPGLFWWEVGKIKTLLVELRFSNLAKLIAGPLPILSSNADSERGFSILRIIHTDQSTVVALMSLKFNSDDCCHEVQFENII